MTTIQGTLSLDHLNMPAQDPEKLASWYGEHLGLQVNGRTARGPGVLLVFQKGEPVNRAPEFHVGLRVPSTAILNEWAKKFNQSLTPGPEFTTFRIFDPESNCIEFYCRTGS
jgi:catechol-2,3-dioxygenase